MKFYPKYTHPKRLGWVLGLFFFTGVGFSQTLPLKEAINKGITNYGIVKAKSKYIQAAQQTVEQMKKEYLPNLSLSAQQDYGTVNGQNGPLYGLGGLGVASSGLPLSQQNWNAAFGALYLLNVNWEFYSFGRVQQRIVLAEADVDRAQKEYEQELFQHKVKIASAYLNLLAGQRLLISQQKNLERATVFYLNVAERAKNGLLPGVDSTMAFAEVSRAKISLTRAKEQVKIQNNELVVLLGESPQDWVVDTNFIQNIPKVLTNAQSATDSSLQHPTRQLFESRVLRSKEQEKMFQKEAYPTLTLFGVFQTRASGFRPNYALDQTAFTHNYFTGVIPTRQNYLFGVGMVWNLTNILRTSKKVNAQKLNTEGLDEEYKAIDLELKVREDAANARIAFAIQNFKEVPLQVAAAQEAYLQRLSLYNNGLSDLTDVSTALFALNRAETDQDIISTNVWQALLIKAAATGNFDLFLNEF